jgi:hypothetical protein
MARITAGILPEGFVPGLTIDRYQEIMRLPIAAFNGLNKPDELPVYQCSEIWKQGERDGLAMHLAQAEEMREVELGYPLSLKYFSCKTYEYGYPVIIPVKHMIEIGTQKFSDISIGAALTLGVETTPNDPVTLVIASALTDASEIRVYYPGEDVEIHPSSVTISGGNITINIPRSRLVKPSLLDDREDHLSYYENDNFLTTVDVKRKYYDISDAAYFIWTEDQCACSTVSSDVLSEKSQLAFPKIEDTRLSIVYFTPATYSAPTWTAACWSYACEPNHVRLNFTAGRRASMYTEVQTARLAHTLMPNKPCSCPTVHQYWQEDIVDSQQNTPYGRRVGALNAWLADSRQKVGQGGKFPSMRGHYGR